MDIKNGIVPTITIGGRVFTDLENLIVLNAEVSGNTQSTFVDKTDTAYQVATGFNLRILAIRATSYSASLSAAILMCYADNSAQNSSSLTNPVLFNQLGYVGALSSLEMSCDFIVPPEKYPFSFGLNSNHIIYCYLEAV